VPRHEDGVLDFLDNCPAAVNPDQKNTDKALAAARYPVVADNLGDASMAGLVLAPKSIVEKLYSPSPLFFLVATCKTPVSLASPVSLTRVNVARFL
jgi:hypothetical protein